MSLITGPPLQDKRGEEEESETLLFALTEMLDSVEDDAAATLSPFDSLPDTELLRHQEHRDKPAVGSHLGLKGIGSI